LVAGTRERLAERVLDRRVDQVGTAGGSARDDVLTRPEPGRLEAFEERVVPSGVVCFSHEKSPANSAFAGSWKCIRRGGRAASVRALLLWLSPQTRAAPDPRFPRQARPPLAPAPAKPRQVEREAARESFPAPARA